MEKKKQNRSWHQQNVKAISERFHQLLRGERRFTKWSIKGGEQHYSLQANVHMEKNVKSQASAEDAKNSINVIIDQLQQNVDLPRIQQMTEAGFGHFMHLIIIDMVEKITGVSNASQHIFSSRD